MIFAVGFLLRVRFLLGKLVSWPDFFLGSSVSRLQLQEPGTFLTRSECVAVVREGRGDTTNQPTNQPSITFK